MKKTAKIISALLVLVMMLAQVVCVSAVTYPKVSISSTQTDHFERTVSISMRDSEDATYGDITYFDNKGKQVGAKETVSFSGSDNYTVTVKVRPNDVAKIVFESYAGSTKLNYETYTVPANGYYNPNSSGSTTSSNGTYDGLKNPGYSSNSNVWDTYDPNAWTGYREETRKDTESYRVTASTLNVRTGAGTQRAKIGTVRRGDIVEVYDIEDGWAVIEFRGHLRFVSAQYLRKVK